MSRKTGIKSSPSISTSDYEGDDDGDRELLKESKISYKRDFMLSFAEMDACKRLPSGFDSSILCELTDSFTGLLKLPSDSDSGSICGKLPKCSWQSPEIGLLGKGGLLKEPGLVASGSAPRVQGSGYRLLSRSNAPYRPPHLCKMNLHSQLVSKDIYNDKTFGSTDCPSRKEAEEERRRRDSFELMRKGQKAIEEMQKDISDEQKENFDPDIAIIFTHRTDSLNDKNLPDKCSHSENPVGVSTTNNDRHYSFDFTHQFTQEGKLVAGISMSNEKGECEACIVSDKKANEHESRTSSHGRVEVPHKLMVSNFRSAIDENSKQLCAYDKSTACNLLMCEKNKQSIQSEVTQHHLTQHCSLQSSDIKDTLPNSASQPGMSLCLPDMSKEGSSLANLIAEPTALRISGNLERNLMHGLTCETSIKEELRATQSLVSQRGYTGIITESFAPSGCAKQSCLGKIEGNGVYGDGDINVGLDIPSEQEQKNHPDNDFGKEADGEDEICLPDEDSLITIDDFILPEDSLLMPDCTARLSEADFIASRNPDDLIQTPATLNICSGRQMYPHFHHSHVDQGRTLLYPSKSQKAYRISKVQSLNSNTCYYNPAPHCSFATFVHPDPLHKPYAELTKFGTPFMQPLQQMLIPGLNQTQDFLYNFRQPLSVDFEMPNLDRNSNQAAFIRRPAKQTHSGWPQSRNF